MANFVSPNQIQIQIGLVLLVRPDSRDDTSQPWQQGSLSHVQEMMMMVDGRGRPCVSHMREQKAIPSVSTSCMRYCVSIGMPVASPETTLAIAGSSSKYWR